MGEGRGMGSRFFPFLCTLYLFFYHASMKKIITLVTTLFVLAIIAAGVWVYMAFFYTKPLTQQELQELTPDWTKVTQGNWSPWYTQSDGTQTWNPSASFNEFLNTIPDQDKAFFVLIEAHYAYSDLMDKVRTRHEPGSSEWDIFQADLESTEIDNLVHSISDEFRKPYLGEGFSISISENEHKIQLSYNKEDQLWDPNSNPNPCLLNCSNLYIFKHLDLVRLVSAYAKLELIREDPDSFVSLIKSVVLSSRLVTEYLKPIDFTMRTIVVNYGYETISWAFENHAEQFSDQHFAQLDELIANADSSYDLFTGPLLVYHDMVRRLIGSDGRISIENFELVNDGTSTPLSTPVAQLDQSVQRLLYEANHYHNLAQGLSEPKKNAGAEKIIDVFDSRRHLMGFAVENFLEGEIFVFDSTAKRRRELSIQATGLRFVIATQRHTLRHGSPPKSKSDIDSDLLPD